MGNGKGKYNTMSLTGAVGRLNLPEMKAKIEALSQATGIEVQEIRMWLLEKSAKSNKFFDLDNCTPEELQRRACLNVEVVKKKFDEANDKLKEFDAQVDQCRHALHLLGAVV